MAGTGGLTRSELLRRAGVAAAAVAVGAGGAPYAFAGPLRFKGRWLAGDLSLVHWMHFIPRYDTWLRGWAKTWGEQNDVEVTIDRESYTRLPALAAAEVKAQRGHDIFGFLSPPARYERHLLDHTSIVREIERRVGSYGDLGRRSTYNLRTKRFFGVADYHVPAPLIWRHDLWNSIGESPATWEHVRAAAPALKAAGHPIGIGLSCEPDSNTALVSLLMCFGAFLQDESNRPALDSENAVEAVAFMADLQANGGESDVFSWAPESNNQSLLSGRRSLIVNAISAIRPAENVGIPFAKDLWLWPLPAGPSGRLALGQYTSVHAIWKFAKHIDAAEKFIADLCVASEAAVAESLFFNFPTFPGAIPAATLYKAAAADKRAPRGKYSVLTTVATKYTRNLGYPGYANAAVAEVMDRFLIPQMFARVSRGELSAEESVAATSRELKQIWARWRRAGKV